MERLVTELMGSEINPEIYEFPMVEYIPLPITTLVRTGGAAQTGPALQVANTQEVWENIRQIYSLPSLPWPVDFTQELILVGVNLSLLDVKYRGFTVTVVAQESPGEIHVTAIPKGFFYKDKLFFVVYEPGGRKLTWTRLYFDWYNSTQEE